MRVVFFGTPEFAVASLEKLLSNQINIVAVVTAPDKPSGRGLQMQFSAVKQFCIQKEISVLQPNNLKDQNFIDALKQLNPDLNVVVAFRMLPEQVWNMPPMGTINLHASLLPKYRGAAPINWSIMNGEKETGVTTFRLQQKIDTGNIIFSEKVEITESMNAGELHNLLMATGANLLLKTVSSVEQAQLNKRELMYSEQNESEASHAPKLFKVDCLINWEKPLLQVYNFIRGLSPQPGAYTVIRNGSLKPQQLKIFSTKYILVKHKQTNGSLSTDNKSFINVYCLDGILELQEIQLEGKKRMHVTEFLKGYRIEQDATLSE